MGDYCNTQHQHTENSCKQYKTSMMPKLLNLLNWDNHQTLFYEKSQPQYFIRNTSVHIITTKYHNSTDHNLFRAFESVFATYLLLIIIISHRIFMDWNAITFFILLIILLVFDGVTDTITEKPYILQKI